MLRTLTLSFASLLLLGLPARSVPPGAAPDTGCFGCQGVGGMLATASNASGGTVSISVAFSEQGECKWMMGTDGHSIPTCRALKGCSPLVTREWSGLPPNTPLKFTVTLDSQTLVLHNPALTNSGSGSGSNDFGSADMPCDDAKVRTFGIECGPCGLSVSTQVRCTSCAGS